MKKLYLLILLSIIVQLNQAQIDLSRFRLDFYFQPNINSKIESGYFPLYNFENDYSKVGLDCGVIIYYSVFDKIEIGSGFLYINRGYLNKINYDNFIFRDENDIILQKLNYIENRNNYNYFSVPLKIRYSIFKINRFEFTTNVGVGLDYLFNLNKKTLVSYTDREEKSTQNIDIGDNVNRFGVSGSFGLDIFFQLNNKFDILVSPNGDLMFTDLQNNDKIKPYSFYFKSRFWNIGCKIGIRMRL